MGYNEEIIHQLKHHASHLEYVSSCSAFTNGTLGNRSHNSIRCQSEKIMSDIPTLHTYKEVQKIQKMTNNLVSINR